MAKIAKIEELAKQPEIDISEYGLKAEGLAILCQARDEIRNDPNNRDMRMERDLDESERDLKNADKLQLSDYKRKELENNIDNLKKRIAEPEPRYELNFEVDPAFAVPKSLDIADNTQLREKYGWLVSQPLKLMESSGCKIIESPLRIVMARSSDEHEMPGKFESHFALYDPAHPEESFNEWLKAAQRVKDSGTGGVIGQMLIAVGKKPSEAVKEHSEYTRAKELIESGEITDDVKFGLENQSFVANTGGFLGRNTKIISAVVGLASKIVRGDDDFGLYKRTPDRGDTLTHTKHNYRDLHVVKYGDFPQKTMDVIDISNPNAIKTIRFIERTTWMHMDLGWGAFPFPNIGIRPSQMMEILEMLQKKAGKHVEVEGTFMDEEYFPHIFQLRKYELPESRLERLAEIPQERIIEEGIASYVAERLKGDLVIIEKQDGIDETALRQKLKGSYILMGPHGHVQGESYTNFWALNLKKFEDRAGLVVPLVDFKGRYAEGCHLAGYTLAVLTELQKKGPVIAIGLLPHHLIPIEVAEKFRGRFESYNGFRIIRDVTIESDGQKGQIFFND